MSNNGLTDEDYDTLRAIATFGPGIIDTNDVVEQIDVTCHNCGHEWVYTGGNGRGTCSQCGFKTATGKYEDDPGFQDGRGITVEMCNAIRAAADDGKTYREIANLFTFIEDATSANQHATGVCSHGRGDYPPVEPCRDPGPINAVDARECANIRERYDGGESLNDIARESGRSQSTVYRHLQGNCSH